MFRRRHAPPAWLDAPVGNGTAAPKKQGGRRRLCRRQPPCSFCLAWAGFCLLLAFGFYMAHPSLPPSTRFIGFQAYERLGGSPTSTSDHAVVPIQGGTSKGNAGGETSSSSGTSNADAVDGPTYPLDVYAPLVHNPVPLTEITVQACFPTWLARCKPLSTPEKDARLGTWVLVDRPLDPATAESRSKKMSSGWTIGGLDLFGTLLGSFETKYIFYRRSRRTDVPRIVDLKIVDAQRNGLPDESLAGWHRIKQDLRTSVLSFKSSGLPKYLYYRTVGGTDDDRADVEPGVPSSVAKNPVDGDPITEIDVLYGPGPNWPGFSTVGVVEPENDLLKRVRVTLSARRRPQAMPELPVQPKFKEDGTFKIMQLADLHFSVEHGECRDVSWASNESPCVADNDTIKMMSRWLDEEKPDMVVFTGDQLNGQLTSWDERSVIPKWVQPLTDRKIPWASIQGNHDSQSGILKRPGQQAMLGRLPYSLTRVGPSHLHDGVGAGNYYIKLQSPAPDSMHLFTLYFLDSGAYAPTDAWHPFKFTGYDWIRSDQVDWILETSGKIAKIARPYVPDGAKDLDKLWDRTERRRRAASVRGKRPERADGADAGKVWDAGAKSHLSKPKALLFVHIPVPEVFDPPDRDEQGAELIFGERRETTTVEGAQKNRGIMKALEAQVDDRDVVALLHGHMHNNVGCQRTRGIWTCFNGGSSFAGYGQRGFERRTRILHLARWGEAVETWERHEKTPGRIEQHALYTEPSTR